ncbi:hypothetical protein Taro_039671 [Colocasia esculenta]|uniref:Protein kinase domain-containing protein n=1 Tax=Colocasia esculenta TaxID=4460 RepID=A0A843WQU5_COLES|nr:hypothetical protein [Colocasia esculenta]
MVSYLLTGHERVAMGHHGLSKYGSPKENLHGKSAPPTTYEAGDRNLNPTDDFGLSSAGVALLQSGTSKTITAARATSAQLEQGRPPLVLLIRQGLREKGRRSRWGAAAASMALSTLLLCFLAVVTSAHGQSTAGFISIDCGHAGEGYRDSTGMFYSPDKPYIGTGVNRNVSSDYNLKFLRRYGDLRSFPNGTRNCYTLPVRQGGKYLVRAGFVYGNYDGLNQPPVFNLYLGVNFWQRVRADSLLVDIIAVAPAVSMQVCLVKNDTAGTPFISTLELRPLADSMYSLVNASQSLVLHQGRYNYGGQRNAQIRYPDDPYDRIWYTPDSQTGWKPISSNSTAQVKPEPSGEFPVPSAVMGTAVTITSFSGRLNFTVASSLGDKIYLMMHFAELQQLRANESRVFDVYYTNTDLWFKAYRPKYLQAGVLYTSKPGEGGTYTYSLAATGNSTLPPILNALEVYTLQQMTQLPTDERDVTAILNIKESYQVVKNWEGDPCAPQQFTWEGLDCIFDASENSRIISLNLSSSNLKGPFPASIANLTALKRLGNSWISRRVTSSEVPVSLKINPSILSSNVYCTKGRWLSIILFRNLTSNQLSGSVPQILANKSQDGSLSLSIGDNPDLCYRVGSCEVTKEKKKKTKIIVPIVISASVSFVLLLAILVLVIRRARKQGTSETHGISQCLFLFLLPFNLNSMHISTMQPNIVDNHRQKDNQQTQSHHFKFSEILSITHNFEKAIGKGGFGIVYLGYLPDRTQVAVKLLSQSSSQGAKEFQAEALVLTRVHHKNLVSLLGYCNDKNNLALVYEFMPQGSLATHLYGCLVQDVVHIMINFTFFFVVFYHLFFQFYIDPCNPDTVKGLSWRLRITIALDSAQGLDYLHNGCKPSIVHRDVKTANILLNENFGAKLADFGLSRLFFNEEDTHVSTAVAGTLGYLDPEYYRTYRLNEKSDIYSFGVVLLELITGRTPISGGADQKIHITKWVLSRIEQGDIHGIADHRLQRNYDTNSIWKVVDIAMACASSPSTQRPTMSEVVVQLKECLATEAGKSYSDTFRMQSLKTMETIPLNLDPRISPSARNIERPIIYSAAYLELEGKERQDDVARLGRPAWRAGRRGSMACWPAMGDRRRRRGEQRTEEAGGGPCWPAWWRRATRASGVACWPAWWRGGMGRRGDTREKKGRTEGGGCRRGTVLAVLAGVAASRD